MAAAFEPLVQLALRPRRRRPDVVHGQLVVAPAVILPAVDPVPGQHEARLLRGGGLELLVRKRASRGVVLQGAIAVDGGLSRKFAGRLGKAHVRFDIGRRLDFHIDVRKQELLRVARRLQAGNHRAVFGAQHAPRVRQDFGRRLGDPVQQVFAGGGVRSLRENRQQQRAGSVLKARYVHNSSGFCAHPSAAFRQA